MLGKKRVMWAACVVALGAASGCGDDGGQPGFGGGCVSNEQICRIAEGSTQMDVEKVLGKAQGYTTGTSLYICQQIVGQQIAHNDIISVEFDSAGKVTDITGFRMGAGASPVPNWPSCTMSATSSTAGGACASVPVPAPNSTVCQTASIGGATGTTTCTDQNGSKWSSSCSGTTCNCSYNDTYVCDCTSAGGSHCCPGT